MKNGLTGKSSRRSFFKKTALAGAGASVLGFTGANSLAANYKTNVKSKNKGFMTKSYASIDEAYEISPTFKRMRQKNTIFCRWGWDPKYSEPRGQGLSFIAKWFSKAPNPVEELPGYSQLEHALEMAAFAGQNDTTGLSGAGARNQGIFQDWNRFANPEIKKKYKFKSPEDAAKKIKRGAKFLGADDVGIAPFDERWIYSKWYDVSAAMGMTQGEEESEAVFPFEIKSVIVTIHEMPKDAMKVPGHLMDGAAGMGYAKMAEVGHKVSVYLNNLGYKAIPAGNDTSLSVPTAIQAGMGELSRMGTMIHPKLGSGVRIQKIYTDLELTTDQTISFGVQDFCVKCKKCAEHCPSDAISLEDQPSMTPTVNSISTNPGVKRWYHDNERCFQRWERQGTGCGVCLTVCPYNKMDNWVHDLSKLVVSVPVGRDIARQLDDAFGYGDYGPENVEEFWNDKNPKQ